MTVSELIDTLNSKGIKLWADEDRLRLNAPKGSLTAPLKDAIAEHKQAILTKLKPCQETSVNQTTACGLSLQTIGCLIGGGSDSKPTVDPAMMAKQLRVTLRPLSERDRQTLSSPVLAMRAELADCLEAKGVTLVPWEQATREFSVAALSVSSAQPKRVADWFLSLITPGTLSVVRTDIDAVIDVARRASWFNRFKQWLAEWIYLLLNWLVGEPTSVADITRRIAWSEDTIMQRLEDPTATQVIVLMDLDRRFTDAAVPYVEKIALGVETLVGQFAEVAVGVSADSLSILNMNLSDSLFSRADLDSFVARSLIPKLYVPIAPLPLGRFQSGHYDPGASPYAQQLVQLSRALARTDLFPAGFKLAEVVRRRSYRDIVSAIVNGRTGVSYGFVAYAEPPQYVGKREISAAEWHQLAPGSVPDEMRQNGIGRRYLKLQIKGEMVYHQVPDIWLVCSRSGADKTNLNLTKDVLRLGMTNSLQLQTAEDVDLATADIRPSYDTYVMLAIALSTALFSPELIELGAPVIHFHGYAAKQWFNAQEGWAGTHHPAVPCGTYESGVFNFLSVHQLGDTTEQPLKLMGLVEPDHGINLIAHDLPYLLSRLQSGIDASQIELGGRFLASLRQSREAMQPLSNANIAATAGQEVTP